jgi:hypothetical protein
MAMHFLKQNGFLKTMHYYISHLVIEVIRTGLGLLFVSLLTIITLHIIAEPVSEKYTYLCLKCTLGYSLLWFVIICRLSNPRFVLGHALASGISVFFAAMVFTVIIPLALNRSTTYFLVKEMETAPFEYTLSNLESRFYNRFICGGGAIQQRMAEQQITGNISQTANGDYILTERGKNLVQVLFWTTKLFTVPSPVVSSSAVCSDGYHDNPQVHGH